jgi:hypothetical protein
MELGDFHRSRSAVSSRSGDPHRAPSAVFLGPWKRRHFLVRGGVALATLFLTLARWTNRVRPSRCVLAAGSRVYPGPVKPLNDAEIRRRGHWGG